MAAHSSAGHPALGGAVVGVLLHVEDIRPGLGGSPRHRQPSPALPRASWQRQQKNLCPPGRAGHGPGASSRRPPAGLGLGGIRTPGGSFPFPARPWRRGGSRGRSWWGGSARTFARRASCCPRGGRARPAPPLAAGSGAGGAPRSPIGCRQRQCPPPVAPLMAALSLPPSSLRPLRPRRVLGGPLRLLLRLLASLCRLPPPRPQACVRVSLRYRAAAANGVARWSSVALGACLGGRVGLGRGRGRRRAPAWGFCLPWGKRREELRVKAFNSSENRLGRFRRTICATYKTTR